MSGVKKESIVESMQQCLGVEKATSLCEHAIKEVGLSTKREFSIEDMKKIVDCLAKEGGLVAIVARNLHARMVITGSFS